MNRSYFLSRVRENLFSGKLSKSQADGINRILDYRIEKWPNMPDNELCYLLATTKHETAHTMQPVQEGHPLTGARLQAYQKKLYYYPYYGRGLPQITHKANYDKFGIKNPDDALKWPVALDIAFRGMIYGMFTGVRLGDCHVDGGDGFDEMKARSIIQGKKRKTDPYAAQAAEVAVIYRGFWNAMQAANKAPEPEIAKPKPGDNDADPVIIEKPRDDKVTTGKPMAQSKTMWAEVLKWVTALTGGSLTFLAEIPWQTVFIVCGFAILALSVWTIRERYLKSRDEGV